MSTYTLTVHGRNDLTARAPGVATIVDRAHQTATDLASNDPVNMLITDDETGERYPFMYHLDARYLGAEAVADGLDELMYGIRAKLHDDGDRVAAGLAPRR